MWCTDMIPIILLILKAGKNPPAIWNILNPSWKNIAAFDNMDVYGHIDYVVRYGPKQTVNTPMADIRISWMKS